MKAEMVKDLLMVGMFLMLARVGFSHCSVNACEAS